MYFAQYKYQTFINIYQFDKILEQRIRIELMTRDWKSPILPLN